MAIEYSTVVRNDRMDQVTAAIDAGAQGVLSIYSGVRPAFGGTAGTLLAVLFMSGTSFPPAAGGVITANPITTDASANAAGTATWFRITSSAATAVIDGDVGLTGSGADLEMTSVTFSVGLAVAVSSLIITEGN